MSDFGLFSGYFGGKNDIKAASNDGIKPNFQPDTPCPIFHKKNFLFFRCQIAESHCFQQFVTGKYPIYVILI